MSDPLGILAAQQRAALATAIYEALRTQGKLGSHRLVTYRCSRRCMLADVIGLPQGIVIHSPAYKLSPSENEAHSSESGRLSNTTDGVRRWKAHIYFLTEAANVGLTCDHVRQAILEPDDIRQDAQARHTEVVVRSDGERCPG